MKTYTPKWMSTAQKTGFEAEQWVKAELEKLGYEVQMHPDWAAKSCDLIVNGVLSVEVKKSNHRKRTYTTKAGDVREYDWFSVDVSKVDMADRVVVFVAEDEAGERFYYVIPGPVAGQRQSLALSSHPRKYSGFLSAFLENWDVVDYLLAKRYQQEGQLSL